jgi:NADH dehydrogenase FAD-containing subunit
MYSLFSFNVNCNVNVRASQDVPRFYPHLIQFVRIKLVEASDRVLMAFDEELQVCTAHFCII